MIFNNHLFSALALFAAQKFYDTINGATAGLILLVKRKALLTFAYFGMIRPAISA